MWTVVEWRDRNKISNGVDTSGRMPFLVDLKLPV